MMGLHDLAFVDSLALEIYKELYKDYVKKARVLRRVPITKISGWWEDDLESSP